MSALDAVGFAAGLLTTLAFLPQAILTWRTRKAIGVSLGMYLIFVAGIVLWLIYGIALGAWPVIIANAVTLVLAAFILVMKIRFG